ncbi:replication protein A 70 kDa DNA-binding subunit B [Tanacetum coccineum]
MQATVRMALVNQFKDQLKEGSVVALERYSLGEIQPKFRLVNKALRLSFLSNIKLEPCPDFNGSMYGFDFRGYKSITSLQQEEDGQFDVIGHVVACEDLDNYDNPFSDFLSTCSNHGKIIMVLQLAMMKMWDGKMCVQNGYYGTKLFVFDGSQPIVQEEFHDVKEYSMRLFAKHGIEKSENTSTRISTSSKNSMKETFVSKFPPSVIAELLDRHMYQITANYMFFF